MRIARTSCATRIRHNPRARTTLRRPRPARFARRSVRVHLTSAVREPQEAHCQLCSSAASARLQPLSEEGVVPAHQGNDRSEPPLRPLDYLPLKNNVSHGHGSLAAHVSVFARAPGDVKSIGSPRRRRNTRTSCLNTNAQRPLLIACVARGRDDATTPPSQDGDRSKPCGRALVFGRPRRVGPRRFLRAYESAA